MKFIETSAKNADNVEEAFTTMTKEIISIKKKTKVSEGTRNNNITLGTGGQNVGNTNKKCSC